MFISFFPNPKQFFWSAVTWAAFCILLWYMYAKGWGGALSLGGLVGFGLPEPLVSDADEVAQAAFSAAQERAQSFWVWQYMIAAYLAFVAFWMRSASHKWARWSVAGSALIVFVAWFLVQLDVMINQWFGDFYNLIQKALSEPDSVSPEDYYGTLATFLKIAMVYVIVAVLNNFFSSHYIFRWRTAMNERYTGMWDKVRGIEGASQRVQEDTMKFSQTMEHIGTRFINSVLLLIAFIPILWGLSEYVKVLPIVGEVPQALVFVALIWSAMGTSLLALVGIRLPGLEFRNQRVEAAYRKELVLGEEYADRAHPPTLSELYKNVRRNYFRLYLNYLYFDVARFSYLQAGAMVPYIAMGPTIVTAGFTLGVMQQTIRAFGRVEDSFQFLVHNWKTIVELMSIYKRLAAFEKTIEGQQLSGIELEAVGTPAQ